MCIVPLGWLSIEAYLDKMKLLFLWRLLLLSMNCIYKQVAITRICEHINSDYSDVSPIGDMVDVFRKYELMDILTLAVSSGVFVSIDEFRNIIKKKIYDYENNRFQIAMFMSCNFHVFSDCSDNIRWWTWWKVAYNVPEMVNSVRTLIRLLLGVSSLRHHVFKYGYIDSEKCNLCAMNVNQTVGHLLFECCNTSLVQERQKWFIQFTDVMPEGLRSSFFNLNDCDKVISIFSGFKSDFIPEYLDIYCVVCNFVCSMYGLHAQLSN